MTANRCREYTAVKNLKAANTAIVYVEILIIELISMISLNKFNDGGAAMLADSSKNHHIDKDGQIANIPLVK